MLRRCQLARLPHEDLGFDLTPADARAFDFSALLASDLAGAETVREIVGEAEKSAEVAAASLLGRLVVER